MGRGLSYRDLSVETVMNEAGLSRTIFYRHFDGLPAVVIELLQQLGSDLDQAAENLANSARSPEELRVGMRTFVEFFRQNGATVRAVAEGSGVDSAVAAAYDRLLSHFSRIVADGFDRMKAEGRIDSSIDSAATAEALTSMNDSYLRRALGRRPQEDPELVLNTIVQVWNRTLFKSD
jgi:AcrR family transcriptional regulator